MLNMDINMINTISQVIEIEDDVIDLDAADRTPEEVIYEWDAMIRKKMSMFAVADNENILGDLMKEYLQSAQEMANSYEDSETLKHKVFCHINFIYSYYIELQCCAADSYLNNMEDILTLYCNLELSVVQLLKNKDLSKSKYKKRIMSVTKQIIRVLTVYLLEHHDHIVHVLIKVNTTNQVTDPCSEVLNVLYSHFLTKVPAFNFCDESFCRNYVAFQKWKEFRNTEDWGGMDQILYKMFKRTPESIQNSETLRQILMPICHEEVDIISNVFCSYRAILKAYFKHVMAKTNVEIDDLEFNIDLGEDEQIIPVNNDDEEEVQFLKLYYEVERNMSNISNVTSDSEVDIFRKCKEELDDDDDVLFVDDTLLQSHTLHEFLPPFDNEDSGDQRMSNEDHTQIERILPPNPSALENLTIIENISGRICAETETIQPETCDSCQTTEVLRIVEPQEQDLCSINSEATPYNVVAKINHTEVSFASNNMHVSSLMDSANTTAVRDGTSSEMALGFKSVEVQSNKLQNFVYNDYGLTTPPFDVPMDDVHSRSIEPRLYTNISQHHKKDLIQEKENVCNISAVTVRPVQTENADKNGSYDDYGLTPPNETHIEDLSTRLQEKCVYTNIGHKDLLEGEIQKNLSSSEQIDTYNNEVSQRLDNSQESDMENHHFDDVTSTQVTDEDEETHVQYMIGQNLEYDEFGDQLETSERADIVTERENENVNPDSCSYTAETSHLARVKSNNHPDILKVKFQNLDLQEPLESHSVFKRNDQIDTGQYGNFIKNIDSVIITKEKLPENYNGNTFLKSATSLNRTNGQTNDISTSTKMMSAVVNNDHNFNKTLSETDAKPVSSKHHSFTRNICAPELNSKTNSECEIPSPVFEVIKDFEIYYKKMNSVPPNNAKKNHRIKKNVTFASSAHIHFEKETPQSHRIPKQKLIQQTVNNSVSFVSNMHNFEEDVLQSDRVLNKKQILKDVEVALERNLYLEKAVKKMTNSVQQTIRVDYDKTTTNQLNKNDTVRTGGENPKLTFIVKNCKPGSLTVRNRIHLEKKPKKRKVEPEDDSMDEPAIRKRAFRTSKKKTLAIKKGRRVQRTRGSCSSENSFGSKNVNELNELLNSGAYSNKPFRLDLTS